ncbi:uncharacterized protein LOC114330824 isoform X1 [Diabrotica virgifera virgifera]|uniref:SANT domain-containing protein n=3 Tax=Diabrotica virgifera virgifera TaxID=50390 RepID=A0ABM5KSX8_DIAVI|nr:uncharacterized protein LOC114330824 isoform X1 [Diabrotica virgifera virgifera]
MMCAMEICSMRIDHGPVQTNTMSYPQRQTQNHRPNHSSQATHSTADIYKPSRSPISTTATCYPYPSSPQLQHSTQNSPQQQRYQTQQPSAPTQQQQQLSPAPVSQPSVPPIISNVFHHRDYRQNRISLLHPEYGPGARLRNHSSLIQQSSSGVVCIDGGVGSGGHGGYTGGQQPLKKMRLQDKDGINQPLRIDTRPGTYNPQVEQISPTFPDQLTQDDQAFRTTKDELIQQIGKVDREIAKAESQITILKKKQTELEEMAKKPAVKLEVEEDTTPKHQSLPQKIYAENRKRAQNAHAQLDSLGPNVEWPLYNQPSDAPVYNENKRRNASFKRRLLDYFKKKNNEKESRNLYLTDTYSRMMQEWLRKVDKIELSTKRKAKEMKNREFFEKIFPELRKQREDKERFNRVGARVKSEADMEEIMDNLQEQALEDKKMRSYAVIPPILIDKKERKLRYDNHNGYLDDMEEVYKSRKFLNVWTQAEKEVFKEKYLQHPKNFGVIASYLDRKSVSDCVQYYYLSKKTENYKQLFRKARQRTRSARNTNQKINSSSNTSVIDILTTGVTTRLQREQQARTVVQPSSRIESSSNQLQLPISESAALVATPPSASTPTPSATTVTPTITSIGSPLGLAITTPTTAGAMPTSSPTASATCSEMSFTSTSVISSNTNGISSVMVTTTIEEEHTPAPEMTFSTITFSTPTTSMNDSTKPKIFLGFSETPISPTHVKDELVSPPKSIYSFDNEDLKVENINLLSSSPAIKQEIVDVLTPKNEGKSQEMYSNENIPSSDTLSENKKKKERRKDKDSFVETSDEDVNTMQDNTASGNCLLCQAQLGPQLNSRPLCSSQASLYDLREDQIPPNARVCNTCRCKTVRSRYTHCPLPSCPNSRGRIKRLRSLPERLQDLPLDVKEPLLAEFRIPSGVTKCCSACYNRIQRRLGPIEEWSEEEFNELEAALMELGYNWQLIGERLNKPPQTVKIYVAANRKRLKKCLGEDRKPALSTDEESGSSTSSCEENLIDGDRHSSDTASAAESPPVQSSNDGTIKKIDYDSSATETADEAQTPDQFQGAATITPVSNDGQPLSVKDLVLNVIEFSLMKNPGGQQTQNPPSSGMAPTISSILNNDSNEVTIVSEYNLNNINNQQRQQLQQRSDINLAKLVTPLIGATITPVSGPVQSQNQVESLQSSRDDLIVLQVPDGREPETLDLSIKKPRETLLPVHNKTQPQSQQQMHRDYVYHQERKSSAFSIRSPTKMSTSKLANPKSGSITLGTPIMSQPRYEVLRQIPDTKMGSITQGTPVIPHNMQEKRVFDYFNKRGAVPVQQMQSSQQYAGQYRQAYNVEQQLSSRQIIINDYITSQQMLGRRNEKTQFYPTNSAHRTPSPSQPGQQQRQGVIQRNARPQYIQPGHEALSSLVDVAVQQPSLPVPNAHEGLGKTMADNILDQPHRYQIVQHQQIRQHPQRAEEQRRSVCHPQQLLQQPQQQLQEQQKQQSHQHSQQSHQQPQQQQQSHLQSQPPQQTQVPQPQQLLLSQDQQKQDQQQSVKQEQQEQQPEGEHQDEKLQQSEQEEKEQEHEKSDQQKQPQLQNRQTSRSDNSTLTAASLIDAIITHQINQTAEGNREVVNNTREQRAGDLLFQKFHRGEPSPQNIQDNGEKSPLAINVDVDGDTLNKNLTVKELTDSVISHDFNARQPYYHMQENMNEQWKRRIQQQQNEDKRSQTPLQDERHVIRITQPQQKPMEKMEPVSPPESNNWSEQNYRKYPPNQQSHMSPLDYVKNRIVEVMRTEDDNKKDLQEEAHSQEKDLSDSPGEMVIDEEKHENDFNQQQTSQHSGFYSFVHKETTASDNSQNNEPKPLLSSQYEPLSDED